VLIIYLSVCLSFRKSEKKKKDKDEDIDEPEEVEAKEEDPEELERRVKEQVQVQSKKGKKSAEDIEWFSDTSEEARRKRREAMIPETLVEKMSIREKSKWSFEGETTTAFN
jgi:hypothetical protein